MRDIIKNNKIILMGVVAVILFFLLFSKQNTTNQTALFIKNRENINQEDGQTTQNELIQTTEAFASIKVDYQKDMEGLTDFDIKLNPYIETQAKFYQEYGVIWLKPTTKDWERNQKYTVYVKGEKVKEFTLKSYSNVALPY